MDDIICKCGHSIDYHLVHGCQHTDDTDIKLWCQCVYSPQTVELNALRQRVSELEAGLQPLAEYWKEYQDDEWPPQKVLVRTKLLKQAAALLERKP